MNTARSKSASTFTSELGLREAINGPVAPVTECPSDTIRRRFGALAVTALTLTAIVASVDHSIMNAQSSSTALAAGPVSGDPLIVINVVTRGKTATPVDGYSVEVRCSTSSGGRIKASTGTDEFKFIAKGGEIKRLTIADFPTLTTADSCVVASTGGAGTDVFYRTTATPTNGVANEPSAGMISGGLYQSAAARANGRTVEILHVYSGDFLLSNVVTGPSTSVEPVFTFSIRCDGDAPRIVTLGNSQTRLITGVSSGSVCRVEQVSGGTPQFDDNSGDPRDGVVTIGFAEPACWDLRTATPTCRSIVNVTNTSSAATEAERPETPTDQTTTTVPQNQQPANTAAPAVAAAPASPVSETPAFTG
jgi:hypothetical protein